MTNCDANLRIGSWSELKAFAQPVRIAVFVNEQKVTLEEEVDAMDEQCVHVVAFDHTGQALATGRLLPDGHIGRMAVLKAFRGQRLGSLVLSALLERARQDGHQTLVLHAQIQAIGFYQQHGFAQQGQDFFEANIPHVMMTRNFT
jgi:predicted GNAT family N-acyltransferase